MYWYNYLYADKKVHHISRLKYKIEKGMPHKGVYLIHLPECGSTLLEVIPSVLLQQSHYPVGRPSGGWPGLGGKTAGALGSSRGAALELIRKIIDEVYREQGNFDIPSYLQIGRGSMPESGVTQP